MSDEDKIRAFCLRINEARYHSCLSDTVKEAEIWDEHVKDLIEMRNRFGAKNGFSSAEILAIEKKMEEEKK